MRGKAMLLVGVAIGYAAGTRQGKQGWNRLVQGVRKGLGMPVVQKTLSQAADLADSRVPVVGGTLSSAVHRVAEAGSDPAEHRKDSGSTGSAATPAPTAPPQGGAPQ